MGVAVFTLGGTMRKCLIRDTNYTIYENGEVYSPFGRRLSPWKETNTGYWLIRVRKDKKPLCLRLHRILAECFKPNPEGKPFVRHLNDDKDDNCLENLEWGDNITNTQEGYNNDCYPFKKRNNYKVKSVDIFTREELVHESIRACAVNLGLNRKNISAIIKGKKSNTYNYVFSYFEMSND
ncbi:winged helix-turn-helix DNA-binding domain protein [Vibrio phage 1.084.O._10N.261.49.F5]|nr:winged helix-turn-helix DNA-binding domain protein [Vibrio phage 1.084.O._10N.261.49.F5]